MQHPTAARRDVNLEKYSFEVFGENGFARVSLLYSAACVPWQCHHHRALEGRLRTCASSKDRTGRADIDVLTARAQGSHQSCDNAFSVIVCCSLSVVVTVFCDIQAQKRLASRHGAPSRAEEAHGEQVSTPTAHTHVFSRENPLAASVAFPLESHFKT